MSASKIRPARPKRVGPVPPPDPVGNAAHPVFAIHRAKPGYRIDDLTPPEKIAVLEAMYTRSTMTWTQMRTAGHNRMGSHTVPRRLFFGDIPSWIKDDEEILAFSCGQGTGRIIGVRREEVFCVGWFDPRGTAYSHGK